MSPIICLFFLHLSCHFIHTVLIQLVHPCWHLVVSTLLLCLCDAIASSWLSPPPALPILNHPSPQAPSWPLTSTCLRSTLVWTIFLWLTVLWPRSHQTHQVELRHGLVEDWHKGSSRALNRLVGYSRVGETVLPCGDTYRRFDRSVENRNIPSVFETLGVERWTL